MWKPFAGKVLDSAEADLTKGRKLSAGIKYQRAANHLLTAERMQARDYAPRREAYNDGLAYFKKGVELQGLDVEFVKILYEGGFFTALFVPAGGDDGPAPSSAPCVVSCNGLDSMKEQIFGAGNPEANRQRGISTLVIDQPGTGEALRNLGLVGRHDAKAWGSAAYNYLLTRDDVDHDRIGMFDLSLGGHFAPRIASMDPRFKLCCAIARPSGERGQGGLL